MIASLYQSGSVALASFFTRSFSRQFGSIGASFSDAVHARRSALSAAPDDAEDVRRLSLRLESDEIRKTTPRVFCPCQVVLDNELLVLGNSNLVTQQVYPTCLFVEGIEIDSHKNCIFMPRRGL